MIQQSTTEIWLIIVILGIGTFLLRFSFLGLLGDRDLPDWVQRHLRYTAVTVLPALIAPLVVWPAATGGALDPVRILAAAATVAAGYWTKNALWAIAVGFASFYGLSAILG